MAIRRLHSYDFLFGQEGQYVRKDLGGHLGGARLVATQRRDQFGEFLLHSQFPQVKQKLFNFHGALQFCLD